MADASRWIVRLDRALTLGHAGASTFAGAMRPAPGLPILMYHGVCDRLQRHDHPYYQTVTTPRTFATHIEHLQGAGYRTITLGAALEHLRAGEPAAQALQRKVVITFDDALRDFATHAYPILERTGCTATVFVATAFVGRPFMDGRPCLDSGEIAALAARGVEFGSHSVNHVQMEGMPLSRLRSELAESKAQLEDIVGCEIRRFSYPFRFPQANAAFIAQLAATMDDVGFDGGVTTVIGRATPHDDCRFLPRLPVNDFDDVKLFAAKLAGHYDWLESLQAMRKRVRALFAVEAASR